MTVKPWTVMKDRIGYLLRQLPMTEPLDRLGQFIGRTVPGPSTTAEIHLGSNLGGGARSLTRYPLRPSPRQWFLAVGAGGWTGCETSIMSFRV